MTDSELSYQTMRVIINDKRYGALKTLGERKQAFNEVTTGFVIVKLTPPMMLSIWSAEV